MTKCKLHQTVRQLLEKYSIPETDPDGNKIPLPDMLLYLIQHVERHIYESMRVYHDVWRFRCDVLGEKKLPANVHEKTIEHLEYCAKELPYTKDLI